MTIVQQHLCKKRDFIYNFLSSMRQRINDPLGVRKKKREQGTR